eukprot:CAMPEP_0185795098 /NCGR_PEP_ID=MMETSP1174-20130828/160368_1 /TAXON_ID=35687 /ORGANISM="Dictyocha speculum, Strain CCMP1381" /LENGTH=425 /DNA_ID=CAMNT_0028490371 /DNA_START=34 /DNA_END=1309 /DNA_ORIENTATION=-
MACCSISLFFILSPRGDTIIAKDFRGDAPPGAAESFFRKVKFWDKGDAPPVLLIDGVNYLYIRKNGLLIACTTRFNVSPSIVIELLNRVTKVFKDYCGVLSEEAIRKNFILVYELLDEILDFGYPQGTSTESLKRFIYNEPVESRSTRVPAIGRTMTMKTTPSVAAHKPKLISESDKASKKNEIFVDILERLNVLFSPGGVVLNSAIDGRIQMKSYLSGNPELRLALNEDLVIGKGGSYGSVTLDDCNFHECVQLQDFETNRTLSFIPPDGEFVVLNYRITADFRAPFRVVPSIEEVSPYKLDVILRVRADMPENHYGANVFLRVPVPSNTASVTAELPPNVVGQQTDYNATEQRFLWLIKKFQGGSEQSIRIKITLKNPCTTQTRSEIGTVSLNFEIPMYNVSNLAVRYLRIAEQGKAYNPYRW